MRPNTERQHNKSETCFQKIKTLLNVSRQEEVDVYRVHIKCVSGKLWTDGMIEMIRQQHFSRELITCPHCGNSAICTQNTYSCSECDWNKQRVILKKTKEFYLDFI